MNKAINTRLTAVAALILMVLIMGGCSGSSPENVFSPPPGGDGNSSLGSISGTLVDREGFPLGGHNTTITVKNETGLSVAPEFNPPGSGPEAGAFFVQNLPLGQKLFFVAEHVDQSVGRYLGYEQEIVFSTAGELALGNVIMDNAWLEMGWNSYKQKDYQQSLIHFNRALTSRTLSANGDSTLSSSAYTGMGWVHAKRGRDNVGNLNPLFPGFEWDQALAEFEDALSYGNDADAWVGQGGTYFTLLADVSSDPLQVGPWLPFYGLVDPHFSETYEAFQRALAIDPDYKSDHDLISARDLQATQLFLTWVMSGQVTLNDVENFDTEDLNMGSKQMLAILPDLVTYNPYPQR